MSVRYKLVLIACLLALASLSSGGAGRQTAAQSRAGQPQSLPASLLTGRQLYQEHCSACHGADAKGYGPAAGTLKRPPSDLTTLSIRHGGNFPYDYVSNVLLFGSEHPSHGSAEMPTWGFVFRYLDNQNETLVRQRIANLCGYLVYLQVATQPPERPAPAHP